MAQWQSTCTCGMVVGPVEANSKEEALDKMMDIMTPEAIQQHMAEKHPGEPVPSPEQARTNLASTVEPVS